MTIRLLPLLLLSAYVLFGLAVSIYGPVEYRDYDYSAVTAYIFAFLILFSIGYGFGLAVPSTAVIASREDNAGLVASIFKISLAIAAVLLAVDVATRFASGDLNFDLTGLGKAYVQGYAGYERNSGSYSLAFIIATIDAIPFFIASIWGLFYFKRLTLYYKILIFILIFATLFVTTIGQGKQKQLGDFAIYFLSILAVGFGVRKKIRKREIFFSLAFISGAILILGSVLNQRYSAINVDFSNIEENLHPLIRIRPESEIFRLFGEKIGFSLFMLSQYLSGGYYGLSLGLHLDFYWTWFLGSSYSLSIVFDRLFGFPFMFDMTYPARIGQETGWGISKWHTLFSWLASDMTYPGALIFLAFVGYLYAKAWKESISTRNPFSILLFCLLNIGLVYIPANNQLVHSPGGLALLVAILVLYFVFAPRYNVAQQAI